MTYALYSGTRQLGPLSTIAGYGSMLSAVDKYNKRSRKKKDIPALTQLFDSGETGNPQKVAEDITTLLSDVKHLDTEVADMFRNLKKMLLSVRGKSAFVGES